MQLVRSITLHALYAVLTAMTAIEAHAQPSFPTQVDEAFEKIEVQGGGTLRVDFGAASRATLVDGQSSRVRVSVQSGTLYVTCPASCSENLLKGVRVTAPLLSTIRIKNGGQVDVTQGFPTARTITIDIRGGGIINAASLDAESVSVVINGGGVATVSAIHRLSGQIWGGGSVRYFGDPQVLTHADGGGTFQRVGSSPSRPEASAFVDPRDGRRYETVRIGEQVWMSRNLDFLPRVCRTDDAGCGIWVYGFSGTDTEVARRSSEYRQYGALYSWEEAQKACPAGWHLPTDAEWQVLETALGMSATEAASSVWRGTDEGDAVKVGGRSGLDVILAGWRTSFGKFNFVGEHANFWTATEAAAQHAVERLVGANKKQIGRHTGLKGCGFSVRCVQH